MRPDSGEQSLKRRAWLVFAVYSIGLLLLGAAGFYLAYRSAGNEAVEETRLRETSLVDIFAAEIQGELDMVGLHLRVLCGAQSALALETPNPTGLYIVKQTYLALAGASTRYRDIRFLDNQGRELVRVSYRDEVAQAVPRDLLTAVAERDFFSSAEYLGRGEVGVAVQADGFEIDKAAGDACLVHFASPVVDDRRRRQGTVVLSFDAGASRRELQRLSLLSQGNLMVLGPGGEIVLTGAAGDQTGGAPGFEAVTDAWESMAGANRGSLLLDSGLVAFTTVSPAAVTDRTWKIVSTVPPAALYARRAMVTRMAAMLSPLALALALGLAALAALSRYRKQVLRQHLDLMAHHDHLTGLPNRLLLADRLQVALAAAERRKENLAILFLDLDGFKAINDKMGHAAGDAVLTEAAQRLRDLVRSSDTVARVGGDEFVLVLPSAGSREAAEALASKVLTSLDEPFSTDHDPVRLGGSIGIALYPQNGRDPDNLLALADEAMYRAKSDGKNKWVFAA